MSPVNCEEPMFEPERLVERVYNSAGWLLGVVAAVAAAVLVLTLYAGH